MKMERRKQARGLVRMGMQDQQPSFPLLARPAAGQVGKKEHRFWSH